MTKYRWGTVFFVPTAWDRDDDTLHDVVLESHPDQVSAFFKAQVLWQIAGHHDKAASISRVLSRVSGIDNDHVLASNELVELDQALDGLEVALDAALPDWRDTLSKERAAELRAKYPELDLADVEGWITNHSLVPSFDEVQALRDLLREAHGRGLNVVIDYGR